MSGVIHVSNALIIMKYPAEFLRISKFIPDHMHILGSLAESGKGIDVDLYARWRAGVDRGVLRLRALDQLYQAWGTLTAAHSPSGLCSVCCAFRDAFLWRRV